MATMYQFQAYDPARPRMVTSFKGNQKLIFEGYRYNIHHIVPAKGVKTWRCVCAKKLTSARSWCKGRAETWDNDSQGISKGEHNHTPEHEVAELEYFKSQLILAAIAQPLAPLNDLIDEAISYMSTGVSFGSRESLKKSLTVARKSAESGGFKLKCYKNNMVITGGADVNGGGSPLANTPPPTIAQSRESPATMLIAPAKKRERKRNGNDSGLDVSGFNGGFGDAQMQSFLSLARQCQQQQEQELHENGNSTPLSFYQQHLQSYGAGGRKGGGRQNGGHASSSLLLGGDSGVDQSSLLFSQLSAAAAAIAASGGNYSAGSPHLLSGQHAGGGASCSSTTSSDFMDSGLEMDLGTFTSSIAGPQAKLIKLEHNGIHGSEHRSGKIGAGSEHLCESGNSSARSTPLPSTPAGTHQSSFQIQRKQARINNIFNKLSSKAAQAAGTTPQPAQSVHNGKEHKPNMINKLKLSAERLSIDGDSPKKCYVSVETQTSSELLFLPHGDGLLHLGGEDSGTGGIKLSKCLSSRAEGCSCRVIKVCCCSEETNCWRRRRYHQGVPSMASSVTSGFDRVKRLRRYSGD